MLVTIQKKEKSQLPFPPFFQQRKKNEPSFDKDLRSTPSHNNGKTKKINPYLGGPGVDPFVSQIIDLHVMHQRLPAPARVAPVGLAE